MSADGGVARGNGASRPVYALALLRIDDRQRYGRYVARFGAVLASYDGALLAADESPRVVEGEWDGDKVVLIRFPSVDEFERWSTSDAYREIAEDRIASTRGPVLLVSGIPQRAGPPAG